MYLSQTNGRPPLTVRNSMTPQQSLEVLKQFQDWRTSKRDDYDYSPQDLTQALNVAIEVMEKHYRASELILEKIERIEELGLYRVGLKYGYLGALDIINSLNRDKPDEVEAPYVIPNHTIQIERIEEIIISTAPAPVKLNQIMILIENYKK